MTEVVLRRITAANWKQCINLSLDPSQISLLPSNLYSIAEAQFYPRAQPRAIYTRDDQMVGFILYGIEEASGKWKVFRLMIDYEYQRQGYGRAALRQVIAELAALPECMEIRISYQRTNAAARQLYASLGFVEQTSTDSHSTARLILKNQAEEIGDSIAADSGAAPLIEAQRIELEKRIAEDDANPHDVIPWEQVKTSTLSRLAK